MNEMTVFQNPEFGQVRTIIRDGEPWFVAVDVCNALGYSKARNAIHEHVDIEDKAYALIQGGCSSGKQNTIIINESGLYALIFGSTLESAKRFKRWVTSEVLPPIRKTGAYSVDEEEITINPKVLSQIVGVTVAECIKQLHLQRNPIFSPEEFCSTKDERIETRLPTPAALSRSTPARRMVYSKNLRTFLLNNNMNQRDLCRMGNFRPASVCMWYNGYSLPSSSKQLIIAEIFHVSPEVFYED